MNKEDLVYPLYFLEYEVDNQNDYKNLGYVKHGNFECEPCDKIKTRCDHKFDFYDINDVIYV